MPDRSERVVDRNLLVVFGVTLVAIQGVASIAPAMPAVADAFAVGPERIGLLITVLTLPGVVLTPVLGVLADRWGRKQVLVPSLLLYGLAGGACALAPSFGVLLGLRFLQGVGAASLGALNVTLVGDLYDGTRRATAMGLNASVLSLGTATYPALGGALALGSWRWPFVLPLLAVPIALLVLLSLRNPEPPPPQGLREYLRGALTAMRNRTVAGLLFATVATFVILYGSYLTYLPLRMEERFESDSFIIGVVMSSGSLTTAIVSSQLGKLSVRFGQRRLIQAGFALYAVSLVLVLSVRSQWAMLLPALVFGVAQGINIPTIMDALSGRAPMAYRAGFMSVNGMVLRGGQTLGPVVMGGAFALGGADAPFWAGVGVALGGLAILLASLRDPG